MIIAENISKGYGSQELFRETGFRLNARERLGLVGRNGHGKTTLLRMITGEEEPDSGKIIIPKGYTIGYVIQEPEFELATVLEEGCRGLPEGERGQTWRVEKVLAGLGFSASDLEKDPFELSGGFQVRLNLAKVLVWNPDLLLLDEFSIAVDPVTTMRIEDVLKELKSEVTIVLVTNLVQQARRLADRVAFINDGKLVEFDETEVIFGADLYAKNIQPVWVQVENRSDETLFLTPLGLDPAYYSARESASRLRGGAADGVSSESLEKKMITRLRVPPQSIQSGYIFSQVDEGTKSFNVDVISDSETHLLSFFVPVPGLKIDHYDVDWHNLYEPSEIREVKLAELVAELEAMPCCVRDSKGKNKGDPLNIAFVGEAEDLYYAFMRAGWDQTETIYGASMFKTAASALAGGLYRYSPVSALYVFDRSQDAAMQRARTSIHERNHLRIWLTPLRHEGKPVWIGQISRDIGVRLTWKTITTHKIDPDVDETREFLLEDLAFSQSLQRFGYVGGVGPAPYDEPRGNLTGDPYFTDGRRVVMWISGEPTGLDEIELLDLTPYHTDAIGP